MKKGTSELRSLLARRLDKAAIEVFSRAKPYSHGVDGITVKQATRTWPHEKRRIKGEILRDSYRPLPLHAVAVPKNPRKPLSLSNARPISVPAIWDRIIQRGLLSVIWPYVHDKVYTDCSFGGIRRYRAGPPRKDVKSEPIRKSVRHAISRVLELRDQGKHWVFETDIRDFFSSIDRDRLIADLLARLKDKSLNRLLSEYLCGEIANISRLGAYEDLWSPDKGIPQGGILSSLMANFYLYDFDKQMLRSGFSPVRYIDDFVILAESEERALDAYDLTLTHLKSVGLSIHKMGVPDAKGREKTRIVKPFEPFDFLGVTICRSSLIPKESKWKDLEERLDEATSVETWRGERTLFEVVRDTNAILRGWIDAFSFCNIDKTRLDRTDRRIRDRLGFWLRHHGFTRDRNVITADRAKLIGVTRASEVHIQPLISKNGGKVTSTDLPIAEAQRR